jgi:hypothetical protein
MLLDENLEAIQTWFILGVDSLLVKVCRRPVVGKRTGHLTALPRSGIKQTPLCAGYVACAHPHHCRSATCRLAAGLLDGIGRLEASFLSPIYTKTEKRNPKKATTACWLAPATRAADHYHWCKKWSTYIEVYPKLHGALVQLRWSGAAACSCRLVWEVCQNVLIATFNPAHSLCCIMKTTQLR